MEIKTIDYYTSHTDETKKVVAECTQFKNGAFSALTEAEKEVAIKSSFMTNCSNAAMGATVHTKSDCATPLTNTNRPYSLGAPLESTSKQ